MATWINLIEVDEVDGVDIKDYPDFVDAFVSNAHFKDSGRELTDAELDRLNDEHPEVAQELAMERVF